MSFGTHNVVITGFEETHELDLSPLTGATTMTITVPKQSNIRLPNGPGPRLQRLPW